MVVHGLGRFFYTPLLPYLVEDQVLDAGEGAAVASWNYLGYLIGASLAVRWHRLGQIRVLLPLAILLHTLTSVGQALTGDVTLLSALRLLNGIANGLVFVQAPALILEWLVLRNRAALSGLVYLGVGVGLLLSSGLILITSNLFSGPALWWPAALLSMPLAWWAVRYLIRLEFPDRLVTRKDRKVPKEPLLDRASAALFVSYAGAGLGYILPMTFVPLLAQSQLGPGHWLVDGSWLVAGLATLLSVWLWNHLGARLGDLPALRLNFVVQLLGVLAALVLPGTLGLLLCAALVGGTFMGTVLLTQRTGRALHPHQGPRLSAALIAIYGMAQMAGPWLAREWIKLGGTLESAFWIGVIALGAGLFFAFLVPRPEEWHARVKRP